jgi:hypothetical protein
MTLSVDEQWAVTDAVRRLDIVPRKLRWAHLSLCVLDAVFSINARYGGTARVVRRYAQHAGLDPLVDLPLTAPLTGQQLDDFLELGRSLGAERLASDVLKNRQLTSTRNGTRKAEAALQYGQVLLDHGVHDLADVARVVNDADTVARIDTDLATIRGHGSGARRDYLWMVAGDDSRVKPDRMVFRWLAAVLNREVTYAEAGQALSAAAAAQPATPWEVDHAIWLTQRRTRRAP